MSEQSNLRYLFAILITVTALLLMWALDPLVHLTQASFLLFFGAVTLAALYGGRDSGILSTFLAAIFANYFFLPPQYSWSVDLPGGVRMLLFVVQGLIISVLIGSLRTTQNQSQKRLSQLQASEAEIKKLNQELQHQVNELTLAERTIRTSEERLRVALKNAPIAVFNQDQDLCYTWIYNPCFGFSVPEVVSRSDHDLFSPEDAMVLNQIKRSVLESGIGVREEVKLTVQGQVYYYDLTVEPLRNEQDRVIGITCAAVDLSDRKQANEALHQSEQRFRRLVESNLFGVAFGRASGEMYYANDYFLNMVGYSQEDLMAEQIHWLNLTPPEFLPLDQNAAQELRQRGAATPFEKEYIRKDGSRVPVLIGVALSQEPFDQEQESICFYIDLTDRKQAEAAWQEGKQILDALMEYIPEGITIADAPEVIIRKVSQHGQQLTGRPQEMLEGISVATHFQDWSIPQANGVSQPTEAELPLVRAVRQSEVVVNEEWILHRPDGSKINLLCNAGPIQDRHGNTTGGILAWRDITERKQLLERERAARTEAEAANRVKDEFLAVLSHELRSPLNPILGWSKLLQTKKLDEAKVKIALKTIERNAQLQAELIEDLLDVSRILRGKLNLNVSEVDLPATIQAAIETVRLAAEAKLIQIETHLEPVGKVAGDSSRLQQIVWNLLSNAVKFTPEGGQIEVRLEQVRGNHLSVAVTDPQPMLHPPLPIPHSPFPTPEHAQITVRDTGKGIQPDFLPHVFEYFRQADSTTTRKFGGLGLGLAIVRHLVELHGGTVQVESEGEGRGATFIVNLPLISTPSLTTTEIHPPPPRATWMGCKFWWLMMMRIPVSSRPLCWSRLEPG
ncbi:PAS domain-containing sensor histidine kinase [Egbenema bharatensis]|uniref:PAS domain-containing sensor histidine kinase n=1 Tax=Egbenema bharatensis TaxID=3463334 RepID=UPI003A8AE458